MRDVYRRTAAVAVAVWVLTVAGGCGGKVAVHGKVTLDGQPVEQGAITFVPEDPNKGQSAGATIVGGSYRIEAANPPPPGMYRVEIKAQKKTGKKIPAGSPSPHGTVVEETVEAVPVKYNAKSELKRELKAGDNALDFELTSDK